MSETSSSLLQAVINDDIILESPNVLPKIAKVSRRVNTFKPRRNILKQEIYNIDTIHKYVNCTLNQTNENNAYLDKITNKGLQQNFSKVHIYRKISDILNLQNSFFQFDNVQVVGIYIYNKIGHCIQERKTDRIMKIDLNYVTQFPIEGSTYLFYGTIKWETVFTSSSYKTVPYVLVKFFQPLPCPDKFEAAQLPMKYRPREFDSVISFDVTCNESNFEFTQTNENTVFGEFNGTSFINKIESDEILYYEIKRLMQINIDS